MKRLILFIALFSYFNANSQDFFQMMEDPTANYFEVERLGNEYFETHARDKGSGYKQFQRWLYLNFGRIDENGQLIPSSYVWQQAKAFENETSGTNKQGGISEPWTELGPVNSVVTSSWSSSNGGRLKAAVIDPNNTNRIFVGSETGGVWRTDDGGLNWTPLSDDEPTMDIRSLAVASTTQRLFAGTWSGGLFFSDDDGRTWTLVFGSENWVNIRGIAINPDNNNEVLIGSLAGIFRSTDGGITFNNVSTESVEDVVFHPTNTDIVYASGDEFYRSTNGGSSFIQIGVANGVIASNRIRIGVSPNQPNWVYLVTSRDDNSSVFGAVLRSTNSGQTFNTQIQSNAVPDGSGGTTYNNNLFSSSATFSSTRRGTGGQAWHNMGIGVDPNNANILIIGGVNSFRSIDGGTNWTPSANWSFGTSVPFCHADNHGFWIANNGDTYCWNDGGLFVSTDNIQSWTELSNGIGIRQFYRLGVSRSNAGIVAAGCQDNGSALLDGTNGWRNWLGADGMETIIHPTNPDRVIGTSQNGTFYRTTNRGQTRTTLTVPGGNGAWVTPITQDPTNTERVYIAKQDLYRSDDWGTNWTQVTDFGSTQNINDIAIAPSNNQVIFMGRGWTLFRSTDGGNNFTTSTPFTGSIMDIQFHPTNANYIVVITTGGSFDGRIWRSTDGGANWTNIHENMPIVPAYSAAIDPVRNGIFCGTGSGLYYTNDDLNGWQSYMNGLPHVEMREIEIHLNSRQIFVATYGRGVWSADLPNQSDIVPCISSFPYLEDFDGEFSASNNSCGAQVELNSEGWFNPIAEDDSDWHIENSATPSTGTGPTSDHTGNGGFYLYTEASGTCGSDIVHLMSPCFNLSGQIGLNVGFWYHITGTNSGSLELQVAIDGGIQWTPLYRIEGDHGDQWNEVSIPIDSEWLVNGTVFRLVSTHGGGYQGDIAIDDFSIGSGPVSCLSGLPYEYGFDDAGANSSPNCGTAVDLSGLGGWTNPTTGDDDDWKIRSGTTPSGGTGPTSDHSGSGYYLYAEASNTCSGNTVHLESPCFDLSGLSSQVVTYWYHMNGADMGSLQFQRSTNNGSSWTNLQTITGDKGDRWIQAQINLTANSLTDQVKFRFVATLGSGYRSDIAIDDFRIGTTPNRQPVVTLTPSSGECPLSVRCSATDPDGDTFTLHYTLDNSAPDASDPVVSNNGTIVLSASDNLAVVAIDEHGLTSSMQLASCTSATGLTVYFKRPTWSDDTPQIHHWNTQPNIAKTDWPGQPMVNAESERGADWFKYTIPNATSTSLLFHYNGGNNGGYKTPDMQNITGGCYDMNVTQWIPCIDNGTAPVVTLSPSNGDCPLSVTVSATDVDGDLDLIYYTLDGSTPDRTDLTVSNGGSVNVADGQTLSVAAYDDNDNKSTVAQASCTVPGAGVTVYFKRPTWSNDVPKIHHWNTAPNIASSSWPGVDMINAESERGADWFRYTIPNATSTSCLFHYNNGGNGGYKTTDLNNVTGGCYDMNQTQWVTCPQPLSQAFGEMELEVGADEIVTNTAELKNSNTLKIFPNPAQSFVTITGYQYGAQLIVSNALGQHVWSAYVTDEAIVVNTESWQSGVYFVQSRNENGISMQRLIIQQ